MNKKFLVSFLAAVMLMGLAAIAYGEPKAWPKYKVVVEKGYLALRNAPSSDSQNEFGQLYTGDYVYVIDSYSDSTYWKVSSEKYSGYGWVNKNYLQNAESIGSSTLSTSQYLVKVNSGFLALRTEPSYDDANIIGKLYTGDHVQVLDRGDQYWWVYSPKLDAKGYVNKDYLTLENVGNTVSKSYDNDYRVNVQTGYLALRTAPAYDSSNEIGELYTGDIVTVKDKSNSQYWWVYSAKYSCNGYVNKDYLIKK